MGSIVDRERLPIDFPTHAHSAEFWEALGRVVATFGFLEEVLGKAIFALTATRRYPPDEQKAAYEAWLPQLERALTDQLANLAVAFGKAAGEHPETNSDYVEQLVDDIKKASKFRNVLCHGSWRPPGGDGAAVPFFVDRQKQVFKTPIDIKYLRLTQEHVAGLACSVIDTVTHMGFQFPGSNGPGTPI